MWVISPSGDIPIAGEENLRAGRQSTPIKVLMMDIWATLPYYIAYLSRALQQENVRVTIGSITYYLDTQCFCERGLRNDPGLLDVVGRFQFPKALRQLLKFAEGMLNLLATAIRMRWSRLDVVHVQFLPLLRWKLPLEIWFLRYCRRLGIKLVYTVHDLLPHDTGDRYRERFQQLYGMMDALICHNEVTRESLIKDFGLPPERVWSIPHGPFFYDCAAPLASKVRTRYGVKAGEVLVLWQGFLHPYKGLNFLLDAWVKVQEQGVKARLVIAGTGPPELLTAITREAELLGIAGSIQFDFRFLPLEELISLYQAADVVVYPYKAVTTSGALLTGIAQGKAIIATSLPAFRELLTHRENALLVNYGNTDELAEATSELVNEPATRLRLAAGAKGLNSGDEAWRKIAKETEECYLYLLSNRSRPRCSTYTSTGTRHTSIA